MDTQESPLEVAIDIAYREGKNTIGEMIVPALLERRTAYRQLAAKLRQILDGEPPYDAARRVEGEDKFIGTFIAFLDKEATWLECWSVQIAPKRSPH